MHRLLGDDHRQVRDLLDAQANDGLADGRETLAVM
jgi:hypothetical protein